MKRSICFNVNMSHDNGCQYHRVLQPARFCESRYPEWQFVLADGGLPDGHDVYYVHGLPNADFLSEMLRQQRRGAKIVWSVDDDWTSMPHWNRNRPDERGLTIHAHTAEVVDHIVVSTPSLADQLPGARVCPNLLDLTRFPEIPFTTDESGRKKYTVQSVTPVRLGWVGGETHDGDTLLLAEVLDDFLTKRASEVVLVWFGTPPPSRLLLHHLHRGMVYQPIVAFNSYQTTLNLLRPHAYVCPLAPITFNAARSNLRILESWALGACPIASDFGEYHETVVDGATGLLVSSPETWSAALEAVLDPTRRLTLGLTGRARVEREFDWNVESCRADWYRAFDRILA